MKKKIILKGEFKEVNKLAVMIFLFVILVVFVAGCTASVNQDKIEDIRTTPPSVKWLGSEALVVESTSAPSIPLSVKLTMTAFTETPRLGSETDLTVETSWFTSDANGIPTTALIDLPEGITLVSGDTEWVGDLIASPETLNARIKFAKVGNWTLTASAKTIIFEDNQMVDFVSVCFSVSEDKVSIIGTPGLSGACPGEDGEIGKAVRDEPSPIDKISLKFSSAVIPVLNQEVNLEYKIYVGSEELLEEPTPANVSILLGFSSHVATDFELISGKLSKTYDLSEYINDVIILQAVVKPKLVGRAWITSEILVSTLSGMESHTRELCIDVGVLESKFCELVTPEPIVPGEEIGPFIPSISVWFKVGVAQDQAKDLIESFGLTKYRLVGPEAWERREEGIEFGGLAYIEFPEGSEQEYIQKFKASDIVYYADSGVVK